MEKLVTFSSWLLVGLTMLCLLNVNGSSVEIKLKGALRYDRVTDEPVYVNQDHVTVSREIDANTLIAATGGMLKLTRGYAQLCRQIKESVTRQESEDLASDSLSYGTYMIKTKSKYNLAYAKAQCTKLGGRLPEIRDVESLNRVRSYATKHGENMVMAGISFDKRTKKFRYMSDDVDVHDTYGHTFNMINYDWRREWWGQFDDWHVVSRAETKPVMYMSKGASFFLALASEADLTSDTHTILCETQKVPPPKKDNLMVQLTALQCPKYVNRTSAQAELIINEVRDLFNVNATFAESLIDQQMLLIKTEPTLCFKQGCSVRKTFINQYREMAEFLTRQTKMSSHHARVLALYLVGIKANTEFEGSFQEWLNFINTQYHAEPQLFRMVPETEEELIYSLLPNDLAKGVTFDSYPDDLDVVLTQKAILLNEMASKAVETLQGRFKRSVEFDSLGKNNEGFSSTWGKIGKAEKSENCTQSAGLPNHPQAVGLRCPENVSSSNSTLLRKKRFLMAYIIGNIMDAVANQVPGLSDRLNATKQIIRDQFIKAKRHVRSVYPEHEHQQKLQDVKLLYKEINSRVKRVAPLLIGGGAVLAGSAVGDLAAGNAPFKTLIGQPISKLFGLQTDDVTEDIFKVIKSQSKVIANLQANQEEFLSNAHSLRDHVMKLAAWQVNDQKAMATHSFEMSIRNDLADTQTAIQLQMMKVVEAMTLAHLGKMSPYVLGQTELTDIVNQYRNKGTNLAGHINDLRVRVVRSNGRIMFLIDIPVIDENIRFHLYHVQQIPIFENGHTFEVKPDVEYMAISRANYDYAALLEHEFQDCLANPRFCEISNLILPMNRHSHCVVTTWLYGNRTCPVEKTIDQPNYLSFSGNQTIYSINGKVNVNIKCKSDKSFHMVEQHVQLEGMGEAYIGPSCTLLLPSGKKYHTKPEKSVVRLENSKIFEILEHYKTSENYTLIARNPENVVKIQTIEYKPAQVEPMLDLVEELLSTHKTLPFLARFGILVGLIFAIIILLAIISKRFRIWFTSCMFCRDPTKFWERYTRFVLPENLQRREAARPRRNFFNRMFRQRSAVSVQPTHNDIRIDTIGSRYNSLPLENSIPRTPSPHHMMSAVMPVQNGNSIRALPPIPGTTEFPGSAQIPNHNRNNLSHPVIGFVQDMFANALVNGFGQAMSQMQYGRRIYARAPDNSRVYADSRRGGQVYNSTRRPMSPTYTVISDGPEVSGSGALPDETSTSGAQGKSMKDIFCRKKPYQAASREVYEALKAEQSQKIYPFPGRQRLSDYEDYQMKGIRVNGGAATYSEVNSSRRSAVRDPSRNAEKSVSFSDRNEQYEYSTGSDYSDRSSQTRRH